MSGRKHEEYTFFIPFGGLDEFMGSVLFGFITLTVLWALVVLPVYVVFVHVITPCRVPDDRKQSLNEENSSLVLNAI